MNLIHISHNIRSFMLINGRYIGGTTEVPPSLRTAEKSIFPTMPFFHDSVLTKMMEDTIFA